MASLLAQAVKACVSKHPVATRFTLAGSARHSSALATATGESQPAVMATSPPAAEDNALPAFKTLEGVVSDNVLKAIIGKPMSLTTMSPVQAEVFPLLPELARPYNPQEPSTGPPRDLLVKAKTGTGKTLGFLLPAVEARLQSIEAHVARALRDAGRTEDRALEHKVKAAFTRETVGTLIISPTRELASQIAKEAQRLTTHLDAFGVRLFVGGEGKRNQMREWTTGRRDIVVATPGRLRDVLESEPEVKRGIAKTQVLVLDEADTLLDMGFRPDIEAIKEFLPPVPQRQTFLFSATVSRAIQDIARMSLAPNHKFINCVSNDTSPVHAHVPQYHTILPHAKDQLPHILRLLAHDQLSNPGSAKAIVFFPTTKMTQLFATALRELSRSCLPAGRNTNVYELHSKKSMESRTRASSSFRNDTSGAAILVTSDVSARGVDYPGVTRVIQVGIPGSTEQYVHRVGRTGRANNTQGRGDLVLLPWEMRYVNECLSMVPLKPLRTQDLAAEVEELAQTFDKDPSAFFVNAPVPPPRPQSSTGRDRDRRAYTRPPVHGAQLFQSQTAAVMQEIELTSQELKMKLDEEAIRETFMSLLGYYLGKTTALRMRRDEVVEGLKQWTTDGLGLPVPPYVSEQLLKKIGGLEKPARGYGGRPTWRSGGGGGDYDRAPRKNSWEERGQQRVRSNRDRGFGSVNGDRFSRDREGGEYRGRDSFGDREGRSGRRGFGSRNSGPRSEDW
ncbi:putative DEAD-domain-containing protein [Lyophyllum shimeji]|uniref:ATP-dependent RNA helicase n=1 Tax=Lyophyllum shimeji TaxID=47721 RepID=A0A9P3PNU7_LYOSH|nr:putative DEAD-domain-containing protein [Lyophyllum shimeji]